jgi:two-component system CheB/CheR fusion protein
METAKEELQSTNEELITVNDELQIRNVDLGVLSSDLNNLLSSIEIPIIIVGNDHRIRRFTPKAESVFKLIPSDVGRPIGDIKPIFDMDLDALILKVSQSLTPQEKEIKDRQGRWMRLQIRPYKTIDNRIDGAVITVMDIEALKRQAEESKKARDYLVSVSETVRLPLAILDNQLRLQSANRAFWVHFKFSEQITRKDFFATLEIDADSLQKMKTLLTETLRVNKSVKNIEMDCKFPHIGNRTLLISASLIQWIGEQEQEQEPQAILVSIDDITERKLLEKELAHRLVKEKDARTDAEVANQTKDEFIATLSHELRTPLTSILSWSQVIQKLKFDPDMLKHGIKMIEQAAKMQGQLIEDLLDITRIRSGKLSINFTELNPSEPVSLCIEAVRPMAENKRIVIESEIIIQSEKIWADPERLQQIVWNLLTNAIKFSSERGVIRIRVESVKEHGEPFVSIKVIDQGKGISPEFLPKLFERFSQADSSAIRFQGGLGLGLAIVRDLVHLQGGTVQAVSEGIGKGSIFTVLLPVKSRTVGMTSEATSAAKNKTQKDVESVDLTGLCVMVVEDEPTTLEVSCEALRSFGAKTIACSTVAEALAAFEKLKPDVLISDISMPGEDGYSLHLQQRET